MVIGRLESHTATVCYRLQADFKGARGLLAELIVDDQVEPEWLVKKQFDGGRAALVIETASLKANPPAAKSGPLVIEIPGQTDLRLEFIERFALVGNNARRIDRRIETGVERCAPQRKAIQREIDKLCGRADWHQVVHIAFFLVVTQRER
ncbi:hypothetical protein MnTg04_01371 [bacterium MnTg04]|nr:hypothetical protein MnTg04_01371 [bacterium MnTg04]